MQQKVMLILGFLLEPSVYVVDEPFVGLQQKIHLKSELDLKGANPIVSRKKKVSILPDGYKKAPAKKAGANA